MTVTSSTNINKLKGLYAITDENLIAEERFNDAIESALLGGAKIIQYRDKSDNQKKRLQQAKAIRSLCTKYQATCIINDDIDLAKTVNADGIHLGKDDTDLAYARQVLGKKSIIGISCYDDIDLAINAEINSADYVAFGAMFSSPTKPDAVTATPDMILQAKRKITIPICAIGGITVDNIQQLIKCNTDMAAVISNLFSADDIENTANKLSQHFN